MAEGLTSSITILTATEAEASGLRERLANQPLESLTVEFLVSGVSMINTAFALGQYLAHHSPDMMIQIGIAGSFSEEYPLGSVVEVREEMFPEIGAESPEGWLSLEELGFPLIQTETDLWYNRLEYPASFCPHLPQVAGITVNKVSGVQATIDLLRTQWNPDIETMEGGAFFHAMKRVEIPFMQLRGISNMVEPRNRETWQIGKALTSVQEEAYQFLAEFRKK